MMKVNMEHTGYIVGLEEEMVGYVVTAAEKVDSYKDGV